MHSIKPVYTSQSYFVGHRFVTEHIPAKETLGVFVLLHGFPAWVTKNYDVGEVLAQEGYHVYIPHHEGLGQSMGTFDFISNIQNTRDFLKTIKQKHPHSSLSLVGHSWGGYLCLSSLDYVTDRLILIAPLAHFPTAERRETLINNLYENNQADLENYSLKQLQATFDTLESSLDYSLLNNEASAPKTLLIYGDSDEVIPSDLIRDFGRSISSDRLEIAVFPDDHRLSKRRPVLEKIKLWLAN